MYSSEAPLEICLSCFYLIVITLGCATLCLTQSFLDLFPNAKGLGKDRIKLWTLKQVIKCLTIMKSLKKKNNTTTKTI